MTKEELDKLKEYNKKTTNQNGIIMVDKETFDKKVKLAITLWPQINKDKKIDYLIGKGVGIELALLGKVEGREKNNLEFSYRSHSDFEIYDTYGYDAIPESNDFRYVFGAMETYPKTYTKGLHGLKEGYMDETCEKVEYNGNTYLIPELEILFLDKYMKKEATPRKEGYDAILLLKQYRLDLHKIMYYFKKYVKQYNLEKYKEDIEQSYQITTKKLLDFYEYNKELLEEDNLDASFDNVTKKANDTINEHKIKGLRGHVFAINLQLCPENIEYIIKDGKLDISDSNKKEIENKKVQALIDEENEYDKIMQDIIDEYNYIYDSSFGL